MIFTSQVTQPTVSSTEGQQLVSPPRQGPIPPDQALYKVKWSKYNFNQKKHLHPVLEALDHTSISPSNAVILKPSHSPTVERIL